MLCEPFFLLLPIITVLYTCLICLTEFALFLSRKLCFIQLFCLFKTRFTRHCVILFPTRPSGQVRWERTGDEGGRDLLTLLSSRLRRGRWWLVTAQRASCSPPGLSCWDLSLGLFACSLSQAADHERLGSVNSPLLSPSLLLDSFT